jgi:hypothetical protein
MLERGDVLLTWQLLREPTGPESLPIPARAIGDHRKAYLTYEGPVSRNRGVVRRVDAGTVEFEEITAERCVVELGGGLLLGRFALTASGDEWTLEFVEPREDS